MNSLPDQLGNSQMLLYADDTAILCSGNSIDEINETLCSELKVASEWMYKHRLTLNYTKTKIMYFGTQVKLNKAILPALSFNGTDIEIVRNFKYLGVMLDG